MPLTAYHASWTLVITRGDTVIDRIWQGQGDLTIGGVTYTGSRTGDQRQLVEVSPSEVSLDAPNNRTRIIFASGKAGILADHALLDDPGPVRVTIGWIVNKARGNPSQWQVLPRTESGYLSDGTWSNSVYSCEVESYRGDVDLGRPEQWSDAAQQAAYPGDKGLEYTSQLADGFETTWPP